MAVICTLRARQAPMAPPIAMATITISQEMASAGGRYIRVVSTARPMPVMPKRLPCREVAGEERPRSARMNRMPETR